MNSEDKYSRAYFWASSVRKNKITNRRIIILGLVGIFWLTSALFTGNLYSLIPGFVCGFAAWINFERKGFIESIEAERTSLDAK